MKAIRSIAQLAVLLASTLCLLITIWIWRSVSAHQNTWPFPALYFVELMALACLCAVVFLRGSPSQAAIAWASAGVFTAFSILGAMTVGLLFFPVALAFLVGALLADLHAKQNVAAHLIMYLAASVVQTALMFELACVS